MVLQLGISFHVSLRRDLAVSLLLFRGRTQDIQRANRARERQSCEKRGRESATWAFAVRADDSRFEYLAFFLTDSRAKVETARSLTKKALEKMKTVKMKLGFVETTSIMFDVSCRGSVFMYSYEDNIEKVKVKCDAWCCSNCILFVTSIGPNSPYQSSLYASVIPFVNNREL